MKHQFSVRHKAFMAVVREIREEAGLTQRELSAKLKRAPSFIQRVEIGERSVSFLEAIDIAEAVGVDPFDLLDKVLSYDKPKPALEALVVTAAKPSKKPPRRKK